jgi:hypothetical protein
MRNDELTITCMQANCRNGNLCCPKDHEKGYDWKRTIVESIDPKNHNN